MLGPLRQATPCCANTVGDLGRFVQVIGNSLIYGTRKDVSNAVELFFVGLSPGFERLCAILKMGSHSSSGTFVLYASPELISRDKTSKFCCQVEIIDV